MNEETFTMYMYTYMYKCLLWNNYNINLAYFYTWLIKYEVIGQAKFLLANISLIVRRPAFAKQKQIENFNIELIIIIHFLDK